MVAERWLSAAVDPATDTTRRLVCALPAIPHKDWMRSLDAGAANG